MLTKLSEKQMSSLNALREMYENTKVTIDAKGGGPCYAGGCSNSCYGSCRGNCVYPGG